MAEDPKVTSAKGLLTQMLTQWGISELADEAMKLMKQGLANDAITLQLQDTDIYKKRFAGNEERKKKGLQVLSPAEYVSVETQYKTLARQYGLPAGFYDSPDDLSKFIGNDLSPQEFDERAKMAQEVWLTDANNYRQAFSDFYGVTDSGQGIALILDPLKAEPIVQRQVMAAKLRGNAVRNEVDIDRQQAEYLAALGVNEAEAVKSFATIGARADVEAASASRFGESLSDSEQIDAQFTGLASAQRKRDRVNRSESALFEARSATTGKSLTRDDTGSF